MGFLVLLLLWPQSALPARPSDDINHRLRVVEAMLDVLQLGLNAKTPPLSAVLDCASGRFVEIGVRSSALSLLAACEGIDVYLEGFKITVVIGNPHSMPFTGFQGELYHSNGETVGAAISAKTREVRIIEPLQAGTWTRVAVVVNPAAAKDVKVVGLRELQIAGTAPRVP